MKRLGFIYYRIWRVDYAIGFWIGIKRLNTKVKGQERWWGFNFLCGIIDNYQTI